MTDIAVKSKADLTIEEEISVLENEIQSGQKLVKDRITWLSNPLNKKKSTYQAIKMNTREVEEELDQKIDRLMILKKKIA
ncbi:MAG TPA: hypothetical protein VK207_08985 [Bacteroidales bacterium]|nr:hypothetical protein [Bacteroidales bacterium]